MRVMVLVKATADSEEGFKSSPEELALFEAMGAFNEQLIAAGILDPEDMAGLKPTSAAKRVAFEGSRRMVMDGPFTETKELVAGYWLWTVKDMDEAVEWVKKCPNPMAGPSEIEIRPLYEAEDMPDFDG